MRSGHDIIEEHIRFKSGSLNLEGQLAFPESAQPGWAALIAGAHPLLGAKPDNNIMDAMRKGLASGGAVTMSFSYRGTGRSESGGLDWQRMISDFWKDNRVPEESHWLEDGRAALHHLNSAVACPIVLIGYSFGCWIVSELSVSTRPTAIVCISPNPTQHDLSGLCAVTAPLLVISSDNDFSCSLEAMQTWFGKLQLKKHHALIPQAEHFFRGRESEVVEATCTALAAFGMSGVLG